MASELDIAKADCEQLERECAQLQADNTDLHSACITRYSSALLAYLVFLAQKFL